MTIQMIMIVAGMIGIFIFFVLLFSNSNDSEKIIKIKSTGAEAYIQIFRNKQYQITNDDIPGIIDNGPGSIIIIISKNKQGMNSTGFDNGGMNFVQINGKLYVNDIDIWQLVNEMKNRR